MSIFPSGLTGISTAKILLWANGMNISWVDGYWIESWFGDWVPCGSQVSSNNRAFPRSEIGSAIVLHLAGAFDPPKVSLSAMRAYNFLFQLI